MKSQLTAQVNTSPSWFKISFDPLRELAKIPGKIVCEGKYGANCNSWPGIIAKRCGGLSSRRTKGRLSEGEIVGWTGEPIRGRAAKRKTARHTHTHTHTHTQGVTFLCTLCGREEGKAAAFVALHRRVEKKRVDFATVLSWLALSCALTRRCHSDNTNVNGLRGSPLFQPGSQPL